MNFIEKGYVESSGTLTKMSKIVLWVGVGLSVLSAIYALTLMIVAAGYRSVFAIIIGVLLFFAILGGGSFLSWILSVQCAAMAKVVRGHEGMPGGRRGNRPAPGYGPGPGYSPGNGFGGGAPGFNPNNQGYGGPNPGYQTPNPGYQAPNPGYQAQNPGYQAPNPGYQTPNPGYQAQNQGYQAPNPAQGFSAGQDYNAVTYAVPTQPTDPAPQQAAEPAPQQPADNGFSGATN